MALPGGSHVLIVDDLPEFLNVVQAILTDEGVRVTTATMPPDDLEDVLALAPDAIVLDFIIAGTEIGCDFLERLKSDPHTAPIPVVVCTAATRLVERMAADLTDWNCHVLPKPFELEDLLSALAVSLGQRGPKHDSDRRPPAPLGR
jgi:CheY-like chemotaxis protein